MPQFIKIPQTKVVTKNGDVELSIMVEPIIIEITLNINADGAVSVASASTKAQAQSVEEPTNWVVPSFNSNTPKIKFGKNG